LSLESVSNAPPTGAGPVSKTVAVEEDPPVTTDGPRVRELGANRVPGGTTVISALCVVPLYVAVTFTVEMKPIAVVGTVNVVLVAPLGTVTPFGTLATA
jgi:hypothetical protein